MASVVRRGNSWSVVVDLPREGGKRRQKWITFHTETEAQAFLAAWNSTREGTVSWAATEWLERKALSGLSDATLRSYAERLRFLLKYAADANLAALRAFHVEQALAQASPRNRQNVYRVIRMFLKDMRGDAPNVTIHAPKVERQVWSIAQARIFLSSIKGDPYELLFRLALHSGLRKGELLSLRWSDFDGEGLQVWGQKVGRSRYVALDASTAMALVDRASKGRIFQMHPHTPNKALARAIRKADVPYVRFHDLRHIHATLALGMGADVAVVARRLGHVSVKTTISLYQHPTTEHDRALAEQLGQRLE